jgi:hypothetical protein
LVRFGSSRLGSGEKDFAERKAERPRLRAQPSPFRWEDQFNLSLDHVRLPNELTPFHVLYPTANEQPPPQYGFNWDD